MYELSLVLYIMMSFCTDNEIIYRKHVWNFLGNSLDLKHVLMTEYSEYLDYCSYTESLSMLG